MDVLPPVSTIRMRGAIPEMLREFSRVEFPGYIGSLYFRRITWTAVALNEAVTFCPSSIRSSSRD